MRVLFICYTTVVLALSNYVHGARILGLFPHTGKSHHMVFEPLLRKLAEKGHCVTVASYFPLKNPPANYTDISFEGLADLGLGNFDLKLFESLGGLNGIPVFTRAMKKMAEINLIASLGLNSCSKVINFPPLIETLRKKFDLVLVESFNSDCMLGLLHVHDNSAPIIGLSSSIIPPWTTDRVGSSGNPSYVPIITTEFTSRMTFLERMENTFWKICFSLWYRHSVQAKEQALIENRFGRQIPHLEDLGSNVSLLLVNTYHALNGARPLVPGLVEVGGMHLDHTKKNIPPALSNYVHGARILGLLPHTGKSHHMVYEPLLRKLADRGHHVTVASYFPLKNPPANYTDISFVGLADLGLENLDLNMFESINRFNGMPVIKRTMRKLAEINYLTSLGSDSCSRVINFPPLVETLRKKFDLVLVESFNSDCMLGLLHVHDNKAPIIGLSSCIIPPWTSDRVGNSGNPSHVPMITTIFTSRMTFLERMENTFWKIFMALWYRYSVQAKEQTLIENRFGRRIPHLEDLGKNMSMVFVNTFHALNGVRPLVPGLVEVGGMHLDHTKKIYPTSKLCY